ncbi:acyl-CoA dehydrogenase [Aeromicrobium sp. SMF47]|uniref:Acyl-CoA dehydrogenase n=1 Tax=Aeromicrobium yanjiei TaxID=2662028 RepID=A0A5Q2MIJ2_9ACTN|nr:MULTISPECIES: acyl-CoA dehydrogenase family protein [Aeromicrobium]MRJ77289.1 acyl-CoA dehydrogenase [Aeromicrobium yanjiei]MRK01656.1 acyl-CoA dehydrogenase [Aeromicrobium sp. S22]QGG41581.1 acyl-CoA dehydrogenase [Aeromicrobium yanjiei]
MSFSFTAEQEELRQLVRRFCEEKSSSEHVRRLMDSDDNRDDKIWSQMADQLGLQGLSIPEAYGGSGFGPVELGIVLEEMGRTLLVAPYFSTVAIAGQTLALSDDEAAKQRWLPGIADGSLTATLAIAEESGSWELDSVETTAAQAGDEWSLTGTKMYVLDGATADLLLVVARAGDELGLFAVDGAAAGVTRSKLDSVDLTRDLGRVELDGVSAVRIGSGDATEMLVKATDLILAAFAAEQIGGAAKCLEMAVDYAKIREQFGRPIGSFQAIKHKCADMLLEVESGKSASYYASSVVAAGDHESSIAAALAKAYCSTAFTHAAKENIQIHGGIGFTWEHDAHLYLKRAKSSELLFGSPARHRERLADLVGI